MHRLGSGCRFKRIDPSLLPHPTALLHINLRRPPMHRLGSGCCFKRTVPRPRWCIADSSRTSASHADPECPSREFARRHTRAAAAALTVPPLSSVNSTQHPFGEDQLEDYLQWRGWDIKATLEEHQLDSSRYFEESAVGLISHPLTFPLTLGRFVNEEFAGSSLRKLRVCVVGARAECTLPVQYWRELLVSTMQTNMDFQIDFVGPDVPLKSSTVRTVPLDEGSEQSPVLEMRFKQSYLHQTILDELKSSKDNTPEKIKNQWDMFVLFNPGIGHPNLSKHWTPTLRYLAKTQKPILLTAHSELDSERDLKVVEQILSRNVTDEKLRYKKNPFSSRLESVDPFPLEAGQRHLTRANHSYISLTSPN